MVSSEEEVDPFAPAKLAWQEEAGSAYEGEGGGGGVGGDAGVEVEHMGAGAGSDELKDRTRGSPTAGRTQNAHQNCSGAAGGGRSATGDDDASGSDDSLGGGSESSSDESLAPFDLKDDRSDLKTATAPRHLRQLLSGLRAKEGEHEVFSSSLASAAPLIRAAAPPAGTGPPAGHNTGVGATGRAAELRILAVALSHTLLHLSNTYRLTHFRSSRTSALVALTVTCPEEVAPYLVGEFYGRNHTLEMRMEALNVIRAAAEEMAAPPTAHHAARSTPDYSATTSTHASVGAPATQPGVAAAAPIHTSVHTGTVHTGSVHTVGKSRRWHSAPRPRAPAAASRLAVVAPLFFFPLMARYDDPQNVFRLLGDDCFLLEALLLTLSTLLRGAGAYPCARPMARALCDLAWVLRFHPESVVRRAVLVCWGTVARALSSTVALQELASSLDDVYDWLGGVLAHDADDGCQALAAACHALLTSKLREQHGAASYGGL